jgi:Fic family protein
MQRITGKYSKITTAGETVQAFVPNPLPPAPPLEENSKMNAKLHEVVARLSELRVASHLVPSPDFFNYAFVRQEAILSSQIEGVQATLTDLFNYEVDPERETADLLEVCNYLDALQCGTT